MEIKEQITKIVNKAKTDKDFHKKLMKDPADAIEELLGVKLPKEQVNKIMEAVKANLTADKAKNVLGDVGDKLGGIFKK